MLSDKNYKVFNYSAYDGSGATYGSNTNAIYGLNPPTQTSSATEVIFDVNTYVNKKLVQTVPLAHDSGAYP